MTMSSLKNEVRSNCTSTIPGIRARRRGDKTYIDANWYWPDGRRGATSYGADKDPVEAVQRALDRRQEATGEDLGITAKNAWKKLKTMLS